MKWMVLRAMMLACAVLAAGQSPVRDTRAERSKISALENAWNQSQIHRDGEALNRLTTDTFVYTDWDGTLLNKSQFIAGSAVFVGIDLGGQRGSESSEGEQTDCPQNAFHYRLLTVASAAHGLRACRITVRTSFHLLQCPEATCIFDDAHGQTS